MFAVIIAVGIIAVSIFTVKPLIANFKAPTVNNDTDAISVITLKQDVVPGDVITEDMLAQAKIDNKTYNQIAMNNTDIYKWDRCKDVIGLYATEYIPQEQYMSVNSVSSNFELKANPYGSSNSNFSYVDIPITEDLDKAKLLIGQKSILASELTVKAVKIKVMSLKIRTVLLLKRYKHSNCRRIHNQ